MKKTKLEKVDGLGPNEIRKLKIVIRQVWAWSHARMLVIKRCSLPGGYYRCENQKCKKRKHPKIYVDHIEPIGTFHPETYILRSFVPSDRLQGLCHDCHKIKTKADNALIKDALDFY